MLDVFTFRDVADRCRHLGQFLCQDVECARVDVANEDLCTGRRERPDDLSANTRCAGGHKHASVHTFSPLRKTSNPHFQTCRCRAAEERPTEWALPAMNRAVSYTHLTLPTHR